MKTYYRIVLSVMLVSCALALVYVFSPYIPAVYIFNHPDEIIFTELCKKQFTVVFPLTLTMLFLPMIWGAEGYVEVLTK